MAYKNIRLYYDSEYSFNNIGNIYMVFCLLDAMLREDYLLVEQQKVE